MTASSARFLTLSAALIALPALFLLAMIGCSDTGPAGDDGQDGQPATSDPPIVTGEAVAVSSETVSTAGGKIIVSAPGTTIDGMSIEVPEGAYAEARTFAVSYEPIIEHRLPEGFEPATPLIDVDNGGEYADEFMTVTVPVEIPEGYLAVPYFYDKSTGQLEIPLILGQNEDSVTFATRHFSDHGVVRIPLSELDGIFAETAFMCGLNDWQFKNRGSYISGGGNCSGMSMAALWYFIERTARGDGVLSGKYDSYSLPFGLSTSRFTRDDDVAIKLCSMVQTQIRGESNINEILDNLTWSGFSLQGDAMQFYAIAAALKLTEQPVYVIVEDSNANLRHAVICYRLDNYTLYVADPNFPGDQNRKIIYRPGQQPGEGQFEPYSSVPSAWEAEAGALLPYDKISYVGRTTAFRWDRIGHYWSEMESGIVGRGENGFPDYDIRLFESDDPHGYILDRIDGGTVHAEFVSFVLEAPEDLDGQLYIYHYDQIAGAANPMSVDTHPTNMIRLQQGDNLLGFHVRGMTTWTRRYRDDSGQLQTREHSGDRWAGFDWVNILYEPEGPTSNPPTVTITEPADRAEFEVGESFTLNATVSDPEDGPLPSSAVIWRADDSEVLGTGLSVWVPELSLGDHEITVTATDSDGNETVESITITVIEPEDDGGEEPSAVEQCNLLDKIEVTYGEVTREPGYCATHVDVRFTEQHSAYLLVHLFNSDILNVQDTWYESSFYYRGREDTVRLYMSRQEGLVHEGQEYTDIDDVIEIAVLGFFTVCDQFKDDPVAAGMPTLAIDNPCR